MIRNHCQKFRVLLVSAELDVAQGLTVTALKGRRGRDLYEQVSAERFAIDRERRVIRGRPQRSIGRVQSKHHVHAAQVQIQESEALEVEIGFSSSLAVCVVTLDTAVVFEDDLCLSHILLR